MAFAQYLPFGSNSTVCYIIADYSFANDQDPTIYCRVSTSGSTMFWNSFLDYLAMSSCHDILRHAGLCQVVALHHYATLGLYHDPNQLRLIL